MKEWALIGLLVFSACAPTRAVSVGPLKAQALIAGGAAVLDVRTHEEFAESHLPGATLIPIKELKQKLDLLPSREDGPVLVYCTVGVRSARAGRILGDLGYQVYNLRGGIVAWQSAGLGLMRE